MMSSGKELSPNITAEFRNRAMAATFGRFPKPATNFFKELENTNKAWFDDNCANYEKGSLEPCNDLVAAMGSKLAKISPDIHA